MIYEKHLSEPWFTLIKIGLKKVEGRLNDGVFAKMRPGDKILFFNTDFNFKREIIVTINSLNYYNNFKTYLENETLERALPGNR